MITAMSWNMNQRGDAWLHLQGLAGINNVTVAMVQEARQPERIPNDWVVHPTNDAPERWRIKVPNWYRETDGTLKPTRRWFASALVGLDERRLVPREAVELHEVIDGELACSHPGQFAVGDITLDDGKRLTVVSLYGIWDRMADTNYMYADATLHRAISDLAVVFQEHGSDHVLVAGDLNTYSYSDGTAWGERAMTVFTRLASYGLEIIGPFRRTDEPRLAGCPCPDDGCRHVHTFLYQSNPDNRPHQLDFFLATPALRDRLVDCWADPDPTWPGHSDHRPIFATFDL